jgi:hypothetical protein
MACRKGQKVERPRMTDPHRIGWLRLQIYNTSCACWDDPGSLEYIASRRPFLLFFFFPVELYLPPYLYTLATLLPSHTVSNV